MKIPLNWLKDYIETKKTPKEISDSFTLLGLMLDKPVTNDVLDLEHRMDRSDWLSVLGCARDLAAFEGISFKYPDIHIEEGKIPTPEQSVEIRVECPDLVNRFNTRVFRGITVTESPKWLKEHLESYGIPSINNIVDITNFVMVEYGQPMHAQDLSKFEKQEIVIRRAKKDEEITTLLGETLKLDPECFVLTQNGKAIVLGGIVGGKDTGVTAATTDIVLDAGNYNQVNIRKNSRKLKIQNETVLRYDKFLHPMLCEIAIQRATKLILELAGGEYYENYDYYPNEMSLKQMKFRYQRLSDLSGMNITPERVKEIFKALEYKILKETEKELYVEVPYFRTDVEVEDDLVADILRINNYQNIPFAEMNMAAPKEVTEEIYKFEDKLRDILVALGLHEHITNPLVTTDGMNTNQVKLENSLTSDKTALRTNLHQTLAPVIELYRKHKIKEIGIFEIGKEYVLKGRKDDYSSYVEPRIAEIIYSNENYSLKQNTDHLKRILSTALSSLEIQEFELHKVENYAEIFVEDTKVGKIDNNSIELDIQKLMEVSKSPNKSRIATRLTNYRTEDFSLIIPDKQTFGEAYKEILNSSPDVKKVEVIEEFKDEKIGIDKKSILVRVTFENEFQDKKTSILDKVRKNFGIEVRS